MHIAGVSLVLRERRSLWIVGNVERPVHETDTDDARGRMNGRLPAHRGQQVWIPPSDPRPARSSLYIYI